MRFESIYHIILSFVLCSLVCAWASPCDESVPFSLDSWQGLQRLYNATEGGRWQWSANTSADGVPWDFSSPSTPQNPCTQHWQYIGCDSACGVTTLSLSAAGLRGSLPDDLFLSLPSLFLLNISRTRTLTGPLPSSLSSPPRLHLVDLSRNALTGALPTDLSRCEILAGVDLSDNLLTGPLHSRLTAMPALRQLRLSHNLLTGPLWDALSSLSDILEDVDLRGNSLTGTLPADIGDMPALMSVQFGENFFTGSLVYTLSDSLAADDNESLPLYSLNTSYNLLTGTLPAGLFSLSALRYLDLSNNRLHGSLAREIVSLSELLYLELNFNLLSGELPAEIGSLSHLEVLYLDENVFSHTIPSSLSALSQLELLNICGNRLHGPLFPESQTQTGTQTYGLQRLLVLNVSRNALTGTLPSVLSRMPRLLFLDLSHNAFAASLGTALSGMHSLLGMFLQNNAFVGSLTDVFLPQTHRSLSIVDLGYNALTGSLPPSLYALPSLRVLSLVHNCLSASISQEVCALNSTLATLSLDGLHASQRCTHTYFPTTNSYPLHHRTTGSIPACLLRDFPKLTTLQLSGNGLRGAIPSVRTVSAALRDLALSHNQLTGTIPESVQVHPWIELDLSFNKLSGTLSSSFTSSFATAESESESEGGTDSEDGIFSVLSQLISHKFSGALQRSNPFSSEFKEHGNIKDNYAISNASPRPQGAAPQFSTASLRLYMNRLSGEIPSQLREVRSIQILEGNLFNCDALRESVPVHDPDAAAYDCASRSLSISLQTIFGAVALLCVCVGIGVALLAAHKSSLCVSLSARCESLRVTLSDTEKTLLAYWETYRGSAVSVFLNARVEHLVSLGIVSRQLRVWMCKTTLLICVVFLPVYLCCSEWYSMYRHTYVWAYSPAFVSGVTPSIICAVFLSLFLVFVFSPSPLFAQRFGVNMHYVLAKMARKANKLESITSFAAEDKHPRFLYSRVFSLPWRVMRNIALLLLVNVIVVVGVNTGFVLANVSTMDLAQRQVIGVVVSLFKLFWNKYVFDLYARAVGANSHTRTLAQQRERAKQGLSALDDEAYSLFASFMTALALFNNVIALYLAELLASPNCFYYTILSAPPVSSSYSTPVCVVEIIDALPVVNCKSSQTLVSTHYNPPFFYSYQCSSSLLTDFAEILVLRFVLSGLLFPLAQFIAKMLQEKIRSSCGERHWSLSYIAAVLPVPLRVYETPLEDDSLLCVSVLNSHSLSSSQKETNTQSHTSSVVPLKAEQYAVRLVTDIAIVLTFGVMFPPLAVVGCLSVISATVTTQLMLGRIVHLSRTQPSLVSLVERINECCVGVRAIVSRGLSPLSVMLALFWGFFLFDMLGDAVGVRRALPILFAVACVPLLLLVRRCSPEEKASLIARGVSLRAWLCECREEKRETKKDLKTDSRDCSSQVEMIETENPLVSLSLSGSSEPEKHTDLHTCIEKT